MRTFLGFVFGAALGLAALAAAGQMGLTIPTVGVTTGPTWATQLNAALALIEAHDHTSGKGARITSTALNINAATEMNSQNLTEIKGLLFDNNGGTQTGARSLWVYGNELYYRNGSSQNVQLTSGSGLNGSATGGFSGDFSGAATAYYKSSASLFVFYAANSATYDTSALAGVKANKLWLGNNSASRDDFLWDASGTDVLSLGVDTNDDKTLDVSNIINIANNGDMGFGAAAASNATNVEWQFTSAAAGADLNVAGASHGALQLGDTGQAADAKYWGIKVNNDVFTISNLTDAGGVTRTPISIADTGAITIAAASSGTELTVTGEASISSTSTLTGLVTATAGVTMGALSLTSGTIADGDLTPSIAGKSMWVTSANTGATAISDLDDPAVGQVVTLCGGSNTNSSTIADSPPFNLSASMTLSVDDCITLYVQADNDYVELSRVNN